MNTTDKLAEALRLSIKTLEDLQGGCTDSNDGTVEALTVWCPEVITKLYIALDAYEAEAKPAPAEPVAWPSAAEVADEIDALLPMSLGDSTMAAIEEWWRDLVARKLSKLAAPAAPAPVPLTDEQQAVLRFLWGTGLLRGCGFGTKPEGVRGEFWWRDELVAAFPELPKLGTKLDAAPAAPAPAPGYCKHCKDYTIAEPLPADTKDAERYRWLRTCTNEIVAAIWHEDAEDGAYYGFTNPEALDAEIDAAIAASKKGGAA